ncbi:MAG: glycoside hydrolase family 2 protein [Prolixibacteraceae bacterium]
MFKNKRTVFLYFLLIVSFIASVQRLGAQSRYEVELKDNWIVGESKSESKPGKALPQDFQNPGRDWFKVAMPNQIQDILYEKGLIPDPHIGTNPTKCTWVFEKDWIYATRFLTPKNNGSVFLCFDGIDTKADIFLNGHLIAACSDMFRRYRFQVNSFLQKEGKPNILSVVVYSPVNYVAKIVLQEKVVANSARKYLRKTGSDFTSYLGANPNFLKMGIFGKVFLDVPGEEYLGDVAVRTTLSNNYTKASIKVYPDIQGKGTSRIRYTHSSPSGKIIREATINRCDSFAIDVDQPELWQPYTHGKPQLYHLTINLVKNNQDVDKKTIPVGIREVKLVLKDEKTGEDRFAFRINGQLIFLRGGCWAPLEGMTHVWNAQRAKKLLDIFQAGNLNFIRVWGEGEIPNEEFYDECDRRGILIWQEFMTANGMQFPLDYVGYKENFRAEITDNIKRLRNHPGIIIWCGGNEHYLSNKVEVENRKLPLGRELLEEIMPELVKKYDHDRTFHRSSPWGGKDWENGNYPLEGDFHDYTTYRFMPLSTVPLFTTEACMVSPYSANNMRKFMTEEELWPTGFSFKIDKPGKIAWPEAWQYHTASSGWQKTGRIQDYLDPQNAEDLCRVFGTAHGEYLKERYERQRRGVPDGQPDGNRRSWGAAVWRFNDTWPMIYMSVVDYYLEPKIPYYFLKRACEPILLSFEQTQERICAWVINDSSASVSDSLIVELRTFDGLLKKRVTQKVAINAGESKRAIDLTPFGEIVKRGEYLTGKFGKQTVSQLLWTEKFLSLPEATISVERAAGGIVLKANKFVKDVALAIPNTSGAVFDDNYFNLLPGVSKYVKIIDPAGGKSIQAKGVNSNKVEIPML